MPTTLTNRLYPLPDGRDLTWNHYPIENACGVVVLERHTDGHLDGCAISDAELRSLLEAHRLA
ncbi:MAG: hypothetical protein JST64_05460 [Actinobacteria bacterium]|nr:hypothetical protein [Actinomycetota bacterium]